MRIIAILFFLVAVNINAQTPLSSTDNGVEQFDINQLWAKDLQKGKTYTEETEDAVIEYGLTEKFYFVRTKMKSFPYIYARTYYRNNKSLRTEDKYFHKLRLLRKAYSESGKLGTDTDELKSRTITLTIEELITIMKNEYDIDLINEGGLSINSEPPSYVITIMDLNKWEWRVITIDGKNGKTISDEIKYSTCGYPL